jgi:hypothetical protein
VSADRKRLRAENRLVCALTSSAHRVIVQLSVLAASNALCSRPPSSWSRSTGSFENTERTWRDPKVIKRLLTTPATWAVVGLSANTRAAYGTASICATG